MEENKTLVEQLRGINAGSGCGIRETFCQSSECDDFKTCSYCISHSFNAIADRIELEYLPLPRFEDGDSGWHMFHIPLTLVISNGPIGHKALDVFMAHNSDYKYRFPGAYGNKTEKGEA